MSMVAKVNFRIRFFFITLIKVVRIDALGLFFIFFFLFVQLICSTCSFDFVKLRINNSVLVFKPLLKKSCEAILLDQLIKLYVLYNLSSVLIHFVLLADQTDLFHHDFSVWVKN